MKKLVQWLAIVALASTYGVVAFALLHPHVSQDYRAYFIDHTASDYRPMYYPGTPEDGIQFARSGLPVWVHSTQGLSNRESWGRWTDNDRGVPAGLTFAQPFNGPVCLDFSAAALPWVADKTVDVRFGQETRLMHIAINTTEYRLQFNARDADRLDFVLPRKLPQLVEIPPHNPDPRRLGIQLYRLRILPGDCTSAAHRPWPEPQ